MKKNNSDTKKKPPALKYNPELHNAIAGICAEAGFTDEETATRLGIVRSTLSEWKKKYPKFKKALASGKKYSDEKVVKSLYERALGYEYQEKYIEDGPKGRTEKIHIKHLAPEVVAQIFWLKNRRPEEWRDRHDIKITENIDYKKQREKTSKIFEKLKKGN